MPYRMLLPLLLLILLNTLSATTTTTKPKTSPTPTPSQPCPRPRNGTKHIPTFSLYVLSMQWPFSVCLTQAPLPPACHTPPPSFTIRGLWPTSSTPSNSPSCCPASFSLSPILDLAPALRRFWPDLSSASDDPAQWRHAWLTHGSCSGLAERTYFRKTLQLARRYDFLRALNAHGVVASGDKTHDYPTVRDALAEATGGYRVALRCAREQDAVYLDAVQVCLRKTGFATKDCPQTCLDGDVDCCRPDDDIRIPYWRRDFPEQDGNETWTSLTDSTGDPNVASWIGQTAGIVVLGGGLAYWTFKQFFDASRNGRAPRPNPAAYQRITSSR